jgi:hypothetical protein
METYMYSNDQEIIKYVMDAIDEGVSTQDIRKEVSRLADRGSVIDPLAEQLRERMLPEGENYETL